MNILTCIALAVIVVGALTYFLVPLPILSYEQSKDVIDSGKVARIERIRPGVIEIKLSGDMEIDPELQKDQGMMLASVWFSHYVYIRGARNLPKINDLIQVRSTNRLHRFTGRSFNWVSEWKSISKVPHQGKVTPVE